MTGNDPTNLDRTLHPLLAIILGALAITTGFTGLGWLFASTVNAEGRAAALDYHRARWEEQQRV